MSSQPSDPTDKKPKSSLITPVYECLSAIPSEENFVEIKNLEVMDNEEDRLKKFESIIESFNLSANLTKGHSIAAGLALIKIESEGLFKTRQIDDEGKKRGMTLTEFYEYAARLGLGTSPKTLGRCKTIASIWLILTSHGLKVPFNRAPLLPFDRVDIVHVPLLYGKLIKTVGDNPTEDDADRIVSEFLGEKHVPKESSFKALKRKLRETIKRAEGYLSAGNVEEVRSVHAEMRSLVDPGSNPKRKKNHGSARGGKGNARPKARKEQPSSPSVGPSVEIPEITGVDEASIIRTFGPTQLILQGIEIKARHDPFDPSRPPPSDAVIRGAGIDEYNNGFLRRKIYQPKETVLALFNDLCAKVKTVTDKAAA